MPEAPRWQLIACIVVGVLLTPVAPLLIILCRLRAPEPSITLPPAWVHR